MSRRGRDGADFNKIPVSIILDVIILAGTSFVGFVRKATQVCMQHRIKRLHINYLIRESEEYEKTARLESSMSLPNQNRK